MKASEDDASACGSACASARGAADGRCLARLFLECFKIALFVIGGGYAILAVADRVFSRKLKWTREGELLERLPLIQTIPGLIAGNTALYVGHKVAGRLGAAVALVATALPSFFIFLAVTQGVTALPLDNPYVQGALAGSRCAMTGILAVATFKAWRKNIRGTVATAGVVAAVAALLLLHVPTAYVLTAGLLLGLAGAACRRPDGGTTFASFGAIPLLFLKYGLLCFGGGFVLVPQYMDNFVGAEAPFLRLSGEQFSNMIALTQVTPGPVSVNAATYFGFEMGGFWGAATATACLLLPSYFLFTWALASLGKWERNRYVQGLLAGVRPASVGLLVAATQAFAGMSVLTATGFSVRGFSLAAVSAGLFGWTRLPPAALILAVTGAGALVLPR